MVPSPMPKELQDLTQVKEMLICRAFPVMQVYLKPRSGTTSYKGHVATLPHNVQNVANILPRAPKDLPVIVFVFKGSGEKNKNIKVRRQKVLDALLWLKQNNPLYKSIEIDETRIESLPQEDYINIEDVSADDKTFETSYDEGPNIESDLNNQPV